MKKILYLFLLLLPILGFAQSRYGVEGVPMCWTTALGVDSSIVRYVLISTTGQPVKTISYENAQGAVVNVSGGVLRYGFCDCAGALDSLENGSVTWAKLATAVKDSINKSVTWSRLANPVKDSIRIGMNQKRDTSITFFGNYNLGAAIPLDVIARRYNKIALSGDGPGSIVTVTLPDADPSIFNLEVVVVASSDTIQVQSNVGDQIRAQFRKVHPVKVNEYRCLQVGAGIVWKGSVWDSTIIGAGQIGSTELASTSVVPGTYTNATVVVDQDGRLTGASNGSGGTAYTSFQFILDTIPGTGITANESVANYEATKLDSARLKFSTITKAGQRGGWLANGTSGDSIAVSVPFGVVIGDSQAEGHPALHGRLHPNGSGVFSYNYPDSTGQLSYHLTRLTKFPWVNQGLGGQTSESILKRIDRDVIGLTSAVGDGRPNKTLNRKPIICVIIAGINDVFGNYSANRTKANLSAMARKVSQAGIYCVMLTLPGDSIINNAPYVKTIEEINGWLRGGALNQYGTIICDYEKWWKDPAWNDLLHPKPGLIVDDIHPSKVGYDSLANFIVRETKMPVLHSVILHSENAQVSAVSGFSRVTSVRVGGSTFPMAAQVDSFLVTTPLFLRDSAWYRIMASTSVTGTSFTGFNHIRYVFKNNVDRLNQRTRTNPPLSWIEIQGSTNTTGNSALIVRNLSGNPSLTVNDDGSVFNKGKNNIDANTFFGQEVAQGNVSGNGNSGFGQYALLSLTSGGNNSAFGERVLIVNSTGSSNSGFGNRALSRVTTGTGNVGIGTSAVGATTGTNNCGVGSGVLGALTTGSDNLGFGESALSTLTTGLQNTSLGTLSMFRAATSASENTTIGYRAAFEATAPTRSGFSGWNAGRYLADGTSPFRTMTNSMYYGALTKGSADGVTNENVFGYNATGSGSNTMTFGDANITATNIRAARIYTGTTTIAPFKFTLSGHTQLTTPESGTVEPRTDGNGLLFTDVSGSRREIQLQSLFSIVANITLDATHNTVIIPNGSSFTVTLPAASSFTNKIFRIVNKVSGSITIGNYVNLLGATVSTIGIGTSILVQSDGTVWQQVQ
jgi:hypothetical protein